MQGIYKIRNIVDGRYYLGRSQDIEARWHVHRLRLAAGQHKNHHLQAAWNEHGAACFAFEIVEEVQVESLLLQREQVWLDKAFTRDIPYNILELADGSDMPAKNRAGLCSPPRRRGRCRRRPTSESVCQKRDTEHQGEAKERHVICTALVRLYNCPAPPAREDYLELDFSVKLQYL